jgi:hypothetical protein
MPTERCLRITIGLTSIFPRYPPIWGLSSQESMELAYGEYWKKYGACYEKYGACYEKYGEYASIAVNALLYRYLLWKLNSC